MGFCNAPSPWYIIKVSKTFDILTKLRIVLIYSIKFVKTTFLLVLTNHWF